jgi:transposase
MRAPRAHNSAEQAGADLRGWLSWAPALPARAVQEAGCDDQGPLRGGGARHDDHRSNAFVEAMNGLLQQAKRAARGFRTSKNFIAIAYLQLSRLKHLPAHPFAPAMPK